jgi:iron complex transport system permease protein
MLFFKENKLVYSNKSKRKRSMMVIMIKTFIKKNIITLTLAILLLVLSVVSLFIGAIDINIKNFFMDSQAMEVFVISRLPRLLAILCTGIGISVAGLIMQQLCMNKFVSPTTGATISSAQFFLHLYLHQMPLYGVEQYLHL